MNRLNMTENAAEKTVEDTRTLEQKVFELHGKKVGEPTIAKQLNITRYRVRKILKNPSSTSTDGTTGLSKKSTGQQKGSTGKKTGSTGLKLVDVDQKKERKDVEEAPPELNRELWMKATPLIRKVTLNPKFGLYFDYVRERLGYEGDEGDFIMDCIDYYYKQCLRKTVMMVTIDEVK